MGPSQHCDLPHMQKCVVLVLVSEAGARGEGCKAKSRQEQQRCLPKASRLLRRTLCKAGNDASLGVGSNGNDQSPPIALQYLTAAQQKRVAVGIFENVIRLPSQLALINPAGHATCP